MARPFFSLSDSEFKDDIRKRLNQRSTVEIVISAVLHLNVITVLAIALAANGLTLHATTLYVAVAFSFVGMSAINEIIFKKVFFSSFVSGFFEFISICCVILVNVHFNNQVAPIVVVISICMVTFLTLPIAIRSFGASLSSRLCIIASCVSYIVLYDSSDEKIVYSVFPLVVLFFTVAAISYWLYIRQVILVHKQIESEHLKSVVDQKNTFLIEARNKLKNEHEIRDKLIRHIGHDLRQPINTLSYSLFNMEKVSSVEAQYEQMSIAKKSIDAANYLIEDILQISSYQKKHIHTNAELFLVGELFDLLRREYTSIADIHGIHLAVKPCSLRVKSDVRLVGRILRNFLSNAVRHSQASRIVLGARRRRDYVEIQVLDGGEGIPADLQGYLFEEFLTQYKKTQSDSLGLGLSIAKNLADACGARVDISTKEGEGTCCSLLLPY
jgi:signal transduction histidine kinase